MADINEMLKGFTPCSSDEYDNALVFALKKWISDEINSIPENGVYAVGICWQIGFDEKDKAGVDISFAYNTKDHLESHGGEGKYNHCAWKEEYSNNVNKEDSVRSAVDMWLKFKHLDPNADDFDEDASARSFFECAVLAVRELKKDGIFTERFNRDISVLMFYGLEEPVENAVYTASANDPDVLENDYFEHYGFKLK